MLGVLFALSAPHRAPAQVLVAPGESLYGVMATDPSTTLTLIDDADTQAKCSTGNAPSCPTSTMTLYRGGVLIWGTQPDGTMPPGDL